MKHVFIAVLTMLAASQAFAKAPDIKCAIMYLDPDSNRYSDLIEEVSVVRRQEGSASIHSFDKVLDLGKANRPDLVLRMQGHYAKFARQEESFLRYDITLCEKQKSGKDVKCFGQDFSGDVFPSVMLSQSHMDTGKKTLKRDTGVLAAKPESTLDIQMNYRISTGRDLLDDLDKTDEAQRRRYFQMISPVVAVTCAVQDPDFGIEYGFLF